MSTYAVLYRDLFDLRIHKKSFISITLAPYSKFYLVFGFLLAAIIESLIYGIISMIIYEALLAKDDKLASAEHLDLAMIKGFNYPLGPLAWGDRIGFKNIFLLLKTFHEKYNQSRYQLSEKYKGQLS